MMTLPVGTMPSTTLRREHQIILRAINVLEKLLQRFQNEGSFETESFGECVEFFRLFADACHHAKEEDLLFPLLESRGIPGEGGPIGVMLYEHSIARKLTRKMASALTADAQGQPEARQDFRQAGLEYIQLLRGHIFKEDNVLFRLGDEVMSPADQQVLCSRFGEVGCRAFEGRTREQLEAIADRLEARWSSTS